MAKYHTEKKIMRIKLSATNFLLVLYYEARKTICVQGREKKMKRENENMFGLSFKDRVSGEGLKGVGSK